MPARKGCPPFLDLATTYPGGRDQVIAVIAGAEEDAGPYREKLEPVARVVVEPAVGGEISTALAVQAFPYSAFSTLRGAWSAAGWSWINRPSSRCSRRPDESTVERSPAIGQGRRATSNTSIVT
jgi:hypothetical protein